MGIMCAGMATRSRSRAIPAMDNTSDTRRIRPSGPRLKRGVRFHGPISRGPTGMIKGAPAGAPASTIVGASKKGK